MKKLISILLTVTMLCGTVVTVFAADAPSKEYPQKFYDVPKDHWAFSYIAELADRGVIAGYEDGSFKPNSTVTRAEWAKIMVGAAGIPSNDNNVYFSDMKNHWAIPYVNAAKDYLTAYADNTYRPSQAAVREDVTMAMVKLKGYDLSNVDYSYLNFTDTDSISNNIKQYVAVAVEKGLISGFEDNTFRGQATITRAEAATLLWRAFQYGNDNKVVEPSGTTIETPKPVELAKATEKPQATPKPTEKLKATPKPTKTSKPTVEPTEEPTPAPTPEPTEKPYKVDTLVKADEFSLDDRMYAFDGKNTIYYANHNTIYAVDINTSTTSIVLLSDKLTIDNDEMLLDNFYIQNIFYNNSRKALYVNGFYMGVHTANDIKNNYLYRVNYDDTVEFVTDDWSYTHGDVTGMLDNSKIIWGIEYIQVDDYVYTYPTWGWGTNNGCLNKQEADSYIENGDGDLKPENVVFKLNSDCAGFTADSVITATDEGTFTAYNFKGKELYTITADDYEILDSNRSKLNMSDIHRLMITPSNNIIFYDTNAKAFRMISENN